MCESKRFEPGAAQVKNSLPEIPEPVSLDTEPPTTETAFGRRLERAAAQLRGAGLVSSVGFLLVTATGLGYLAGWWFDTRFGTDPIGVAVGVVLGSAAGFLEMFRIVLRAAKDDGQ